MHKPIKKTSKIIVAQSKADIESSIVPYIPVVSKTLEKVCQCLG